MSRRLGEDGFPLLNARICRPHPIVAKEGVRVKLSHALRFHLRTTCSSGLRGHLIQDSLANSTTPPSSNAGRFLEFSRALRIRHGLFTPVLHKGSGRS